MLFILGHFLVIMLLSYLFGYLYSLGFHVWGFSVSTEVKSRKAIHMHEIYKVCISFYWTHANLTISRRPFVTRKQLNQEFQEVKLKSSLRKFIDVNKSWLNVMDYPFHRWQQICSNCTIPSPFTLNRTYRIRRIAEFVLT